MLCSTANYKLHALRRVRKYLTLEKNKAAIQRIYKQPIELFHDGGRYHIETSPLICSANQWTSFYIITVSVMKELIGKDRQMPNTYCVCVYRKKLSGYHSFFFSFSLCRQCYWTNCQICFCKRLLICYPGSV